MSLPNSDDIQGMDWAFEGQPFDNLVSNGSIDTFTLDWAFEGHPFTAAPLEMGTADATELISVLDDVTISYISINNITSKIELISVLDEVEIIGDAVHSKTELISVLDEVDIEFSTHVDYNVYFSCRLGILQSEDNKYSSRVGVIAAYNSYFSTDLGVQENNFNAVANPCDIGNPFQATVVLNGNYIYQNPATDQGNSLDGLHVNMASDGFAGNLCELYDYSFTLDNGAGNFSITSSVELGQCNDSLTIFNFPATISSIKKVVNNSKAGWQYSGYFGPPKLKKKLAFLAATNSQIRELIVGPPLGSGRKTISIASAIQALAAAAGVTVVNLGQDATITNYKLGASLTVLEAMQDLAAKIPAALRWNGSNRYYLMDINKAIITTSISNDVVCASLLPGGVEQECFCFNEPTVIPLSVQNLMFDFGQIDSGIKTQGPGNTNVGNNGSSPQVQLVAKNTKRLTSEDPDLVYDLPYDYDTVYIQTLVPGNGVTGGANLVDINNYVTRNPQQFFEFVGTGIGEEFIFQTNIGGVYQPQAKLNYKVLPVEGSNSTIDAGNFVTSLYVTRKVINNPVPDGSKLKDNQLEQATVGAWQYVPECTWTLNMLFLGWLPLPGTAITVNAIQDAKIYRSDTGEVDIGDIIIGENGAICIVESLAFNYPGYVTLEVVKYKRINVHQAPAQNYGPID